MVGETNKGTCYREALLWYGNEKRPCPMPLSDGKPCGDRALNGKRCPYNRKTGLKLDTEGMVFITYPQANGGGSKTILPKEGRT